MFDRSLCLRETLIRSPSRFVTKPIFMPFRDVGDAVFFRKRGFSKAECFVFSAKGAFPKRNASFSQQKGLFQVGMLRFLSKRGFSKAECSVFSAKGTFPKRNASFSQKMSSPKLECFIFSAKGVFPKWNASFSQKMSSPKLECFIFSEKGSIAVNLHFLRKKGLRVKYVIAPRRNIFDP